MLAAMLAALAERSPSARRDDEGVPTLRRPRRAGSIEREREGYRVRGKRVERIVAMTDLTNPDAVEMLQGTLKRMGVLQALEAAGCGSATHVRFGNVELEWE